MPRPPLSRELQDTLARLGENISRERKRKGYTQEKLAELAGLHPRVIQKIEYGLTNSLVTTALRIVVALGCSLSDVVPEAEFKAAAKRK